MLSTDKCNVSSTSPAKNSDAASAISPENSWNSKTFSDNRIHIRQAKQTVRMTITITTGQRQHLRSLADSSGLNASELVRYALLQLFRNPCISLAGENTSDS